MQVKTRRQMRVCRVVDSSSRHKLPLEGGGKGGNAFEGGHHQKREYVKYGRGDRS